MNKETQQCRQLWRMVIDTAMKDAAGARGLACTHRRQKVRAILEAQEWFTKPKHREDFQNVCDMAGVDADQTRAKAIARFVHVEYPPYKKAELRA